MATKYNVQRFTLSLADNRQIDFYCYTTDTLNGFCHTVKSLNNSIYGDKIITDTKSSYYNRTWERYDYESTLKRACKKISKSIFNSAFVDGKIQRTY